MRIDLSALIGTRAFLCVVIVGFVIGFIIDFVVIGWAAQWPDGGIRPALDTGMAWYESISPYVNSKYLYAIQVSNVVGLANDMANALGSEMG